MKTQENSVCQKKLAVCCHSTSAAPVLCSRENISRENSCAALEPYSAAVRLMCFSCRLMVKVSLDRNDLLDLGFCPKSPGFSLPGNGGDDTLHLAGILSENC